MCFRYLILTLCSMHSFAADQKLAVFAVGMALGGDFKMQRNICTSISQKDRVDAQDNESFAFTYTYALYQRLRAQNQQESLTVGFLNLIAHVVLSPMYIGFRPSVNAQSLVEGALLPVAIYTPIKELTTSMFPHSFNVVRFFTSGISTYLLSRLFVATNASSDRIIMNAFISHVMTHQQNLYCDVAGLKQITASLSYGSKVMPLTQMAISRWYSKSSMITVHPVVYQWGEINKRAEFMHGVVPALVLAGVDLGFNAIAATSVGDAIDSVVEAGLDTVVQPLPGYLKERVKWTVKKTSAEGVKIGTTLAILAALESSGFKCT